MTVQLGLVVLVATPVYRKFCVLVAKKLTIKNKYIYGEGHMVPHDVISADLIYLLTTFLKIVVKVKA